LIPADRFFLGEGVFFLKFLWNEKNCLVRKTSIFVDFCKFLYFFLDFTYFLLE
jgi:hypothetical protein